MSTVTISLVRRWQPEGLTSAAFALARVSEGLTEATGTVGSGMQAVQGSWEGQAADAAAAQAQAQVKTGLQLAAGIKIAQSALSNGASDIAEARTKLLDKVDQAKGEGFQVSDTGAVKAPAAKAPAANPDLRAHAAAADVQSKQKAAQAKLDAKAKEFAEDIRAALQAVAAADADVAADLGAVTLPQGMQGAVQAFVGRALAHPGQVAGPGAAGAAVALAMAAKKANGLFGKGKNLKNFITNFRLPATDASAKAAKEALEEFRIGNADGGFLGKGGVKLGELLGKGEGGGTLGALSTNGGQLLGRLNLPLTVAFGAKDVITGGGYDGARGAVTRVMAAGAVAGAGTLMAGAGGFTVATGGLGAPIAGGAIVVYGAWSVGNVVWDNRQAIADAAEAAAKYIDKHPPVLSIITSPLG